MYRRSYYKGRSGKYSNETVCFNVGVTDHKDGGEALTEDPVIIVPATDVFGNSKVFNFTIT